MSGKIDAHPTKEFFIKMLTKDIQLERAIIDLIDNSIDAARRQLTGEYNEYKYSDFSIEINLSENSFSIKDNCGGISKDIAEKYAFRFGRPEAYEGNSHSVGRFGVGMKRAFFKLGSTFNVKTKTEEDCFEVFDNINDWNVEKNNWEFNYRDHKDCPEITGYGTFIKITDLHSNVSEDFDSSTFINQLTNNIQDALSIPIRKGLNVVINGYKLKPIQYSLCTNDKIKSYSKEFHFDNCIVKVFAGINTPNPDEAGWYIFCNDRLVLESDKTDVTGWKGINSLFEEKGSQQFHNTFAMFRGYVFFESDLSKNLPMNTTKTGIDVNSSTYKKTRIEMISALKEVTTHLRKLNSKEERDNIINMSQKEDVSVIKDEKKPDQSFLFPEIKKEDDNKSRVSFVMDKSLLKHIKEREALTSNKDVGDFLLNYYCDMENID